MDDKTQQKMFEYYQEQTVLPTYGAFKSQMDLAIYEKQRREIFLDKLYLPVQVFKGAHLIEFGPDSGENSLVFAQWGADCTLVEPNPKAHPVILNYFRSYGLKERLTELMNVDLAGFAETVDGKQKYDIIDAENFIYTVKPHELWMALFARILKPDGFLVIFYAEAYGYFMEFFRRALYLRLKEMTGMSSLACARALFTAKWDSIPHKRSFESWVMDSLESPFVRLDYVYKAGWLCEEMYRHGFNLYSSHPHYKDALCIDWFKKKLPDEEALRSHQAFIARNSLSYLLGKKLFLRSNDGVDEALWRLLTLTDAMIDGYLPEQLQECVEILTRMQHTVQSDAVIADQAEKARAVAMLHSHTRILQLLLAGNAQEILEFCNQDEAFIQSWGNPVHLIVFTLR